MQDAGEVGRYDPSELIALCETLLENGEVTRDELHALAEWLNTHPEATRHWPGNVLVAPLQEVWADSKITKTEIRRITTIINRIRREWAKLQKVHAVEQAQKLAGEAAATFDLSKPMLPSINVVIQVKSQSEKGVFYGVDLSGPSCTCPDWISFRKDFPWGHLTRCCKHVMDAFDQIAPSNPWPGWLGGFFENAWRPHPRQEWMVLRVGRNLVLASTAPAEWANVYADDGSGFQRFGFNPEQDRWAYGIEPAGANEIAQAIRRGPQVQPPPIPPLPPNRPDAPGVPVEDQPEEQTRRLHSTMENPSVPPPLPQPESRRKPSLWSWLLQKLE